MGTRAAQRRRAPLRRSCAPPYMSSRAALSSLGRGCSERELRLVGAVGTRRRGRWEGWGLSLSGRGREKGEEELKQGINSQSDKVKSEAGKLRGDIKTLEATLETTEEDKMTKDSQIRTLREEIAHQEELVSKLQKEKRSITDGKQKTEEEE